MRFIANLLRHTGLARPEARPASTEPKSCSYCESKPATHRYVHVHFEERFGFGGMADDTTTIGGVSYSCDEPDCIAMAWSQKAIRTEASDYPQPALEP